MTLSHWTATIFGPQGTNMMDRLYSLQIECPENYPNAPPKIKFVTKINMPGVDAHGNVSSALLQGWTRSSSMAWALCNVRNGMKAGARLPQPPEGTEY